MVLYRLAREVDRVRDAGCRRQMMQGLGLGPGSAMLGTAKGLAEWPPRFRPGPRDLAWRAIHVASGCSGLLHASLSL